MAPSAIEPTYTPVENTGGDASGLRRMISTVMLLLNGKSPSSYKIKIDILHQIINELIALACTVITS